ncbi:hypothetical protein KDK77_10320 [bacterium]|nr:hypothetical protein [bacterium]MCP5463282.1 hypothetical protein [bacterium]
MSIIIRALKKADNIRKNEKKRIAVRQLPFLSTYGSRRGKKTFVLGLVAGLGIVALCTICFFVGGFAMKDNSKKPSTNNLQLSKTEIKTFDQELLELEVERELILQNGLDIEEELALEESSAINIVKKHAVEQKQIIRIYDETTDDTSSSDNAAVNFPDFFISGVVWDFTKAYVFINGVPYTENEVCNGIRIDKISVSQLVVTYNDNEYEIVLQ